MIDSAKCGPALIDLPANGSGETPIATMHFEYCSELDGKKQRGKSGRHLRAHPAPTHSVFANVRLDAALKAGGWALLAIAAALVVTRLPLSDPDEALFACVTNSMLESGDWLIPKFGDRPFIDRPIFHYWCMAASVRTFGTAEWAYRLPSTLSGMVALLATAALAGRLFGRESGTRTWDIAAAFPAFWVVGVAVGHDSSLVALCAAATWAGLRTIDADNPQSRLGWTLLTGLFTGIAILSKGLLGFFLPGLACLFLAWSRRRWPWKSWLLSAVVSLAVAVPWYFMLERCVPGSLKYFFLERHLGGYLTEGQRHGRNSAIIYLPTLALGALPGWWLLWRHRHSVARQWMILRRKREFLGVVGWLAATLTFFLTAGSKNPTYLLPAFIPLAVVMATLSSDVPTASLRRTSMASLAVGVLTALAATPYLAGERSTRTAMTALAKLNAAEADYLWYFHQPPSSRFYGPMTPATVVNAGALSTLPTRPAVLLCRQSQLPAVLRTRFGIEARHLDVGSRYHILEFDPRRRRDH